MTTIKDKEKESGGVKAIVVNTLCKGVPLTGKEEEGL